jgi:hypothetical protein
VNGRVSQSLNVGESIVFPDVVNLLGTKRVRKDAAHAAYRLASSGRASHMAVTPVSYSHNVNASLYLGKIGVNYKF